MATVVGGVVAGSVDGSDTAVVVGGVVAAGAVGAVVVVVVRTSTVAAVGSPLGTTFTLSDEVSTLAAAAVTPPMPRATTAARAAILAERARMDTGAGG